MSLRLGQRAAVHTQKEHFRHPYIKWSLYGSLWIDEESLKRWTGRAAKIWQPQHLPIFLATISGELH